MYTVNYHDEREESQSTFPPQMRALRLMVKTMFILPEYKQNEQCIF